MALCFSLLSLFPDQVEEALSYSVTGRALDQGLVEIHPIQIRDFAINDYGQLDDAPYGGGRGMVMMCQPLYEAWQSALAQGEGRARSLVLSPAGRRFDQAMAQELAQESHIVLICGHYEGIDRRFIDETRAEEVSLGDFVLTGGELAAAVMIDAISRLVPGVLPHEEAWQLESFTDGLLEWPQYTRPSLWRDRPVPPVLLSGHQARIDRYRRLMQVAETLKKRPDLLEGRSLDPQVWEDLAQALAQGDLTCEDSMTLSP